MTLKRPQTLRLTLFSKIVVFTTIFSTVPLLIVTGLSLWTYQLTFFSGFIGFLVTLIFTLTAAFAFTRYLLAPIHALIQSVDRTAQGDLSTEVQVGTHDELFDLAQAFNRMVKELKQVSNVRIDEVVTEKSKTEGIIF